MDGRRLHPAVADLPVKGFHSAGDGVVRRVQPDAALHCWRGLPLRQLHLRPQPFLERAPALLQRPECSSREALSGRSGVVSPGDSIRAQEVNPRAVDDADLDVPARGDGVQPSQLLGHEIRAGVSPADTPYGGHVVRL